MACWNLATIRSLGKLNFPWVYFAFCGHKLKFYDNKSNFLDVLAIRFW